MHSFFKAAPPRQTPTRELRLGEFSMPVPLCKLPNGSGSFLYFKLNDHPALIEEAARLIAEHIAALKLKNPYFVTPEASTLALAHVLRHKYQINGATIYKTQQLTDVDPVSIDYDTVTSLNKKMLYLGKERADEMRDKDIFILDSVCTTGGTISGTYQLLLKAGIAPERIVEATMLFTEGREITAIDMSNGVSLKLHSFGHLPIIEAAPIANNNAVFGRIA
jgi:adenine/guanine phosphoribosyltransferase-like PRPP-binding protein